MTFEEALPAIKDWLSQHGVNPDDVPRDVVPKLLPPDGSVWLPLFARNADGAKFLVDGEGSQDIAMTEVTIRPPLLAPEPVERWLRGEFAGRT
jgi:hypothetical protein